MALRLVNNVEKSVIQYSIVNFINFECDKSLTQENLTSAIRFTKLKYPYLRMRIVKDTNTSKQYMFIEQDAQEFNEIKVNLVEIQDLKEFKIWKNRLNQFGCKYLDTTKNLFEIEVHYHLNQYQLFFKLNHTGCDARSQFSILKSLLNYLDLILSDVNISNVESRPFLNVHDKIDHLYNLDAFKSVPAYKDIFQETFAKLEYKETDVDILETFKGLNYKLIGEYIQLSENESKSLFENCKANKVTVQGVLSTINLICMLNETMDLGDLNGTIKCMNMALCDMRYYFGLDTDDVIKGAAYMQWLQTPNKDEDLWELALSTTKSIHEMKKANVGLEFWFRSKNGLELNSEYGDISSLGKISLGENLLKHIKIEDLKFFVTNSQEIFQNGPSAVYSEAYTFNNKLNLSLCYTFPNFSNKFAQHFLSNFCLLLKQFSMKTEPIILKVLIPLLKKFKQ